MIIMILLVIKGGPVAIMILLVIALAYLIASAILNDWPSYTEPDEPLWLGNEKR